MKQNYLIMSAAVFTVTLMSAFPLQAEPPPPITPKLEQIKIDPPPVIKPPKEMIIAPPTVPDLSNMPKPPKPPETVIMPKLPKPPELGVMPKPPSDVKVKPDAAVKHDLPKHKVEQPPAPPLKPDLDDVKKKPE